MLLALTALLAGITVIVVAVATQQRASTPQASAWGTIPTDTSSSIAPKPASQPSPTSKASAATASSDSPGRTSAGQARARESRSANADTGKGGPSGGSATASAQAGLRASNPVGIKIPAIDVDSSVFPIGKDSRGGLQVPQPGPNLNNVAWYKYSPTPGQTGPAVLEGHVDTVNGPSVFLHLGALTPGDKIKITRADKSVAVFTVDAVRAYQSHNDFPTDLVYGGDLSRPTLRIITCSNFDHSIGHYVGNTIVFAQLASAPR